MADMHAQHLVSAGQVSVLRSLNQLAQRLDRVLQSLGNGDDAETELRAIASEVIGAAHQSPDVALASIYLNQIAGPYAVRHCVEAAVVCALISPVMEHSPAETGRIVVSALTMNAGMMRLAEIFQLKDGPLSDDERRAILRHPAEGAELLRRAEIDDEEWIACVLSHHELDDGSGYPEGRSAAAIPDGARLVGMADRYCALVSARNYRRSMLAPEALKKLCAECSQAWLVAAFEQEIGQHPPGTLVRLKNGETGVVSYRSGPDGARHVHAMRDTAGVRFAPIERRSTREPLFAIAEVLHEDNAGLRFSMREVWGDAAAV